MLLHTIAGIAWDPQLRGFLALGVGVVVLMGSVYLLLTTNLGSRLGFLLAASAFFGWCTIMGLTWWVYGTIGMLGQAPRWEVTEVVYPGTEQAALDLAHGLDTSGLPPVAKVNDLDPAALTALSKKVEAGLDGWQILPASNKSFGEAKATVDEYFVEHPIDALSIKAAADYVPEYSFERGGKLDLPASPNRLERIGKKLETTFWQVKHPPHYAIIQVRPVVVQTPIPGEAPPIPMGDTLKPTVSVIMERNLGDVRFPGAMLTIFSGLMFAVTISMLHRRDLRAAEVRGVSLAIPER